VECGCGKLHTAQRPAGARSGPVGYGPNLAAFAVYLMVVHFIPAHRVVELLESLTGTSPSVGFVHGMINRAAGLLTGVDQRIRTLITLAHTVSCDETPLRVGPKQPPAGKKKAERYLLVACTELYTHYLLGDRSLDTFSGCAPGRSPPWAWATSTGGAGRSPLSARARAASGSRCPPTSARRSRTTCATPAQTARSTGAYSFGSWPRTAA
jgi:hypothetical protein